ncbi:MAG TPA: RNA polymerase sigma factor [Ktedonobacteraceae bacterium]
MSDGTFRSDDLLEISGKPAAIGGQPSETVTSADDWQLVELLRAGDEAAFVSLIHSCHSAMLRLATIFVTRPMVAEEVVQETWMAVLEGLPRFEGRSSLKTWIFRILTNRAKTRAVREGRSMPFASFADEHIDSDEPAVEPDRFRPPGAKWAGGWVTFPSPWEGMPEERLLSKETRTCIEKAIEALPANQREIITLRDIEGWSSEETCSFLGISEGNQRVLLHRARSKVRGVLERYFAEK